MQSQMQPQPGMEGMEQQPVMPSMPYESPMGTYGSAIQALTNPSDLLQKLEDTYRSIIRHDDGRTDDLGEPLMSELGINRVMGIITTIVNQVTIFSNLSRLEISMAMTFLADTLVKMLMMNRKDFEIQTASARDEILYTGLMTAFICMKRAIEGPGNEKGFWKGSQQEITTRIEGQKQKGMFSSLLGWGKKR